MHLLKSLQKSPEWHAARRQGIGGSDANIILGGNEEEILRLWREKRGEIPHQDLSDDLAVMMGCYTEPFNIAWFTKRTGLEVGVPRRLAHPEIPYMRANLDGWVHEEDVPIEAKHVGGFQKWSEVLAQYMPQLTHIMIVSQRDHIYLSALIGNSDWRCERIAYDPFFGEALLEAEKNFWDCVQSGNAPCAIRAEPPPPGEITREVDMTKDMRANEWAYYAVDWLNSKEAVAKFDKAARALKGMVDSDVKTAAGYGIVIERDRRGALRIKAAQ